MARLSTAPFSFGGPGTAKAGYAASLVAGECFWPALLRTNGLIRKVEFLLRRTAIVGNQARMRPNLPHS
jgi:hypothetical protein